jgi:hypothetical protein
MDANECIGQILVWTGERMTATSDIKRLIALATSDEPIDGYDGSARKKEFHILATRALKAIGRSFAGAKIDGTLVTSWHPAWHEIQSGDGPRDVFCGGRDCTNSAHYGS